MLMDNSPSEGRRVHQCFARQSHDASERGDETVARLPDHYPAEQTAALLYEKFANQRLDRLASTRVGFPKVERARMYCPGLFYLGSRPKAAHHAVQQTACSRSNQGPIRYANEIKSLPVGGDLQIYALILESGYLSQYRLWR